MRTQFVHAADMHLGYEQYGNKERFNDFARAFFNIVDEAIAQQVEFVILAGDLFHKRALDPPTLLQAVDGLDRLRSAGIRVIGVEGNHERAHYHSGVSWVEFLAEQGLVTLLNPNISRSTVQLTPWDGSYGAYTDLPSGVRVYGIKYYGASTSMVVESLCEALQHMDRPDYVILVMHAGLEGILPRYSGTLTHRQVAPLRRHVDYLALGHIHKPYHRDNWLFNPGSPETCSVDEAAWEDRGYYLVNVDTNSTAKHEAVLLQNQRRPFCRLSLNVDAYVHPEGIQDALRERLAREARRRTATNPVVELTLDGILAFDRHDLDLSRLESMVRKAFDPLLVLVRDLTRTLGFEGTGRARRSREQIEREVMQGLVKRDARFSGTLDHWTDLILDLKRMALVDASPQEIVNELRPRLATLGPYSDDGDD